MKAGIIEKCTSCHEERTYVVSGHAQAILRGNNDSAVCSDCHGLHDTRILHTAPRKYLKEARQFYTRACYRCRADEELMRRNNLTTPRRENLRGERPRQVHQARIPRGGMCRLPHLP